MTQLMIRERLPNRRDSETRVFEHGTHTGFLTESFYENGKRAEVFVNFTGAFSTSDVAAAARDAAVLVSIALQHGVPTEMMRAAVTRLDNGEPASITGRILDELCAE